MVKELKFEMLDFKNSDTLLSNLKRSIDLTKYLEDAISDADFIDQVEDALSDQLRKRIGAQLTESSFRELEQLWAEHHKL